MISERAGQAAESLPGTALDIYPSELDVAEEGMTPPGFVAMNRLVDLILSKLGVSSSAEQG
jgi:hypothetical protein